MFMSTAAATDRAVDERRDVAALAVQHHQGLIRVKAAQRHRAGDVRTAVIDGCEKLHEGTNRLSVLFSSPLPDPCNALSKMTSIGTGLSETVRLATQLPITTIWLPASASGATCASAAVSELGADWIVCAAAGIPSASTEAESDRLAASLPYVMNIACSERLPTVLIGRHRMTSPSSSKATTAVAGHLPPQCRGTATSNRAWHDGESTRATASAELQANRRNFSDFSKWCRLQDSNL